MWLEIDDLAVGNGFQRHGGGPSSSTSSLRTRRGVLFGCSDGAQIDDQTCYGANVFDTQPTPDFSTGSLVNVAKVALPYPKAGGRWNTMLIRAQGTRLSVVLNGVTTGEVEDALQRQGRLALQAARGTVKFRRLEVRSID